MRRATARHRAVVRLFTGGVRRHRIASIALAALAALGISSAVALPAGSAMAAGGGSAVLNVTITPVDANGNPMADLGTGYTFNVGYQVKYSCAVADCVNTTVQVSAPPTDPGSVIPPTASRTLIRYTGYVPAFPGAPAPTGSSALTFGLGTVTAGSSGSFLVNYNAPNLSTSYGFATAGPDQFFPDLYKLHMSATIDADTAVSTVTADAAALTWHITVPTPAVVAAVAGTQKPGTLVSYSARFGTGALAVTGGNAVGVGGAIAAAAYHVEFQLPPEAEYVNTTLTANGAVDTLAQYDPVTHKVTWDLGSAANPDYQAAVGWGSQIAPANTWNQRAPWATPRIVNVRYPAANFAGIADPPDADGCNFSTQVTATLTATVTYLDAARTVKSTAPSPATQTVQCWSPFTQAEKGTKASTGTASGGQYVMSIGPDTTGMVCPANGRDEWGRSCTPGSTIPAFSAVGGQWAVAAFNEANIPGTAIIEDDDLTSPNGAPVTVITGAGAAAMKSVEYWLDDGTHATFTGATFTAPAGRSITKAIVTSQPIPAAVIGKDNPTNAKREFDAIFRYAATPSTVLTGTTHAWTNTASMRMTYDPVDTDGNDQLDYALGTATATMRWEGTSYAQRFTAIQVAAPAVQGGGTPLPGTNVTFSFTGLARTVSGSATFGGMPGATDITPEYVFFAPAGWTLPRASDPTFTGAVPAGVSFTYGTATFSGVAREYVVATWPNTVTFGNTAVNWPAMNVVAAPTAAAAGKTATPAYWIGDSRNQYRPDATTIFDGASQDTPDVNGDGLTTDWFATAAGTALLTSGVPNLSVVKSICKPNIGQPDGCDWISDPGSIVGVSTSATGIKYRVTLTNTGSQTLTNVKAYDVLPYPNDTGTSQSTATTPRGSTFQESLTGVANVSSGVTLAYSTSNNPCRDEVYLSAPGCVNDWSATVAGAAAIRATVASLAVNASVSFDYTGAVAGGTPADALGCNSVAVSSNQTIAAEPQAVCASTQQADLEVAAPDRLPLQVGRPGTIAFTLANHGGSSVSPASVSVDIPAGVIVTDLAPAGYLCSDAAGDAAPIAGPVTLTCQPVNGDGTARKLDKTAPPETLALAVRTTADAGDTICVGATVSGPLPDPVPGNNDDTACVTVAGAATPSGLTLNKDDGVATVAIGGSTTYTITVTNQLVAEAVAGAVLTDTLPAGVTFVSATGGGTAAGQTVTWSLADLQALGVASGDGGIGTGGAGSSIAVTVTVKVNTGITGPILNTASVTAPDPANPTAPFAATASDSDVVTNVFIDGNAAVFTPQNTPVTTVLSDIVTTSGAPIDPTSVSQETAPAHGSISIDPATGDVTYQPEAGYSGSDSYEVRVCDTSSPAQCHVSMVQILVGDNVVTAVADSTSTPATRPVDIAASANDLTQSGTPLGTPTKKTDPAHGTVTQKADGTFTYTPAAGFSGIDGFTYEVCDTSHPTPVCDTATVTIDVTNVFVDGPAVTGGITTPQNGAIRTPIGDIDTTAGLPVATVTQQTAPAHGSIAIDPTTGDVTYTPDAGYIGPDSYVVTLCDAEATCYLARVDVTVTPNIVTAPDRTVQTKAGTPTSPIDVLGGTTSATGQALGLPAVATGPAHGRVTVDPNGAFVYTPDAGFSGTDTFTYTVCDTTPQTPVCDTATVTVMVAAIPDPPAGLAFTGVDALRAAAIGGLLLLAGILIALAVAIRRRTE